MNALKKRNYDKNIETLEETAVIACHITDTVCVMIVRL